MKMPPRVMTPFEGMDVGRLLRIRAETRGDHPALIWEPFSGEARTWTYRELHRDVAAFAAGLAARGVRSGDRVLVHLDNCPEAAIAWLGCGYAGAVAVTTNSKSALSELTYFAEHSAVVGAVTQPQFADLVAAAAPRLLWIVLTETNAGEPPASGSPSLRDSFASLLGDPAEAPMCAPDPLSPFGVQYTSGTTARPKAVLWTHANALWGGLIGSKHEDLRPEDTHLITLPMFHTNAQSYSLMASLWVGATVVLQPRFSASRFWPVSLKRRCTWTSMVPFCTRALLMQERPESHFYRLWGNGVCEPATDAIFGVKTIGWWGMTETVTHGIVGSPHFANAPMSMGRPATPYEIKVSDPDGQPIAPGDTGDLLIRGIPGLSLFAGYADDDTATAAAFDASGFLKTGDRVRLGEDGFLFFADRAKDMMKVGGENVAASEIEQVMLRVPGVREVAVVAKPHPMLDEVPVAFVIPTPDAPPDLKLHILAACRNELASFKLPQELRIIDSLPRSTLEKVAKEELRRMLTGPSAEISD